MHNVFPRYSIGHFINAPLSWTEFEIIRFEEMAEPAVEDPHTHAFYEILWVDAGQSNQAIDHREYQVRPQSLFFISPGQLHFFAEWEHLQGGSVLFTESFFRLNPRQPDPLF